MYTKETSCRVWNTDAGFVKEDIVVLETDGSNLRGTLELDEVDHCKTISNDVVEVLEVRSGS